MQAIQGIVTIVQESRFQVVDRNGVAHHFLLSHKAAVEPEQLPILQREQVPVRVWYTFAPDVIGHVAARIELLDRQPPGVHAAPTAAPIRAREIAEAAE